MQLKFIHLAAGLLAMAGSALSCVEINEELGKEYIPLRHQYDIYTDTIYLQDIRMEKSEKLSGYSSTRITIGAVKDDFGVTARSSAFTLIPTGKDMDFGTDPHCTQFHFTAVRDTLSWPDENQSGIIQNVNVYKLTEDIGEDAGYISNKVVFDENRIAPVTTYWGQDSLSFNFNPSFGDEYLKAMMELQKEDKLDSVSVYSKRLPGIYITVDEPIANGGRINMFDLAIQISDSYYVSGNYAELKFRSTYGDRENVDTSFLFFFGAQAMQVYADSDSYYSDPEQTPQYALNLSSTSDGSFQTGEDKLYIQGGDGVKPVISSQEISEKLLGIFADKGIDPEGVIIHKASVVLPYEFNEADYDKMYLYPDRLSPTCRITVEDEETSEDIVTFAGLTDASVETENQGDINRSTCCYSPDISHHVQEIIRMDEDREYSEYDIWLLTMANEAAETESTDNSALSEYYQNLAYYDYYNSLYGYGYGGYYGSYYGSYYDSYYGMSNYYNYMLAAQYASTQSSSQSAVSMQLDRDRYYRSVLCGPSAQSEEMRPRLVITYSVSKTADRNN